MKKLRASIPVLISLLILSALFTVVQAARQPLFSDPILPNAAQLISRIFLPLVIRSNSVSQPAPTPTKPASTPTKPGPTPIPTLSGPTPTLQPPSPSDWTQYGHDAQHTSYTTQVVPAPWRWKWSWNGPNAQGGVISGKISLPRNSQPVTGGGRVYLAAGANGVYAIDQASGQAVWNRNPGGAIDSTPAYDAASDSLFVVSSDGNLYRLNASTGLTTGNYNGQAASTLPLPPAISGAKVYFSMGTHVFAIQKDSLALAWSYDAGSAVETPPAVSASGLVIANSNDLYIHAIRDSNGTRAWRVKPTPLSPGEPGDAAANAQVSYGWPVIAESHGLVFIRLRLNWQTLWTWSPWPGSNAQMRANLTGRPDQQSLFALKLSDGSSAFLSDVGNGGFGDGGYLAMGPQPVIKHFSDGTEAAYIVMRGSGCNNTPCDGRYDSHFAEMELDGTTVSGYQAGDVRFMQSTSFPTDEQPSLTMAGDDLFGGHWMFGMAQQILDRSAGKGGSSSTPITTSNLPHIITSASNCAFSASHYCPNGLIQDGDPRSLPAGFYIYYNQGKVYDQYWRSSSSWVVSGNTLYFASNDGALIAFQTGSPTAASLSADLSPALPPAPGPALANPIPFTLARQNAGSPAVVQGTIQYKFNNGREVLLGFQYPHQGAFKALILTEDWKNFASPPEGQFSVGQTVSVSGLIEWFQGDPVIFVHTPDQIQIVK